MKKLFCIINILLFLSITLGGCEFFKDVKFSELEVGETFDMSRDGYFKKLPHNYCLDVILGSKAWLFKVPDQKLDVEGGYWFGYENYILKGHFIKGYYNSEWLVLCKEDKNDELEYLAFNFSSEKVQRNMELNQVCELLNVDSIDWFPICNTNEQRID